ncbi:amino acid adenylation domain-containing protein/natural product biosynthesis luciferase-like monooxygenase protein [Alteromonadaceae bacterium 2753L.S.0a.02]|nr:amino acid adenylation domain-containing protein/natural product biosynthesis luciferase-like monooxygenase protein [Alteromonadaceae bacterium 2753L.S.0a.02]
MTTHNGFEIAVIGMAGRFPEAANIEAFLELLKQGREGTRELSDLELIEAGNCFNLISRENYVKKAACVAGKGYFDAELFHYNARDAACLDPQISMFHECVWEALENAGYNNENYSGLIGLFAGAGGKVDLPVAAVDDKQTFAENFNNYTLAEPDFLCSRIAHKLNLRGPAIRVETACSTSLVAVHLACQSILVGECDIAMAGGVSIQSLKNSGYLYHPDMILSKDGSCRAFDENSSGTMVGEGCGVVVLKLLEEAVEDGDNILAIIKGSAINNDGQTKVGYSAASVEGQLSVIKAALERAEIPSDSVSYIEAHGTGTKLGDPVEIEALADAYNFSESAACKIGAVKSNIGHLGVAAGVAGLIKTVLSLNKQCLFPSVHFQKANPNINFESAGISVNTEYSKWQPTHLPRRAAVSSFGIGGTNAHCILEEYTGSFVSGPSRIEQLICLSANSENALRNNAQKLLQHLNSHWQQADTNTLADVCFTLNLGRRELPYRKAFVTSKIDDLSAQLEAFLLQPQANVVDEKSRRKICFVFPGQGSQYVNMGKNLYETEEVYRRSLDECLDACDSSIRHELRRALFCDAPNDLIHQTRFAQPLLFAVEYALAKQLAHWGISADAMIGHSLGEYVAACLAGVFTLPNALAIVVKRAELMQSCREGSMLSVFISAEEVAPLLFGSLSIAAVNSDERLVVSGDADEIQKLRERLDFDSIPNSMLRTSHAFHSCTMDPILESFEQFVAGIAKAPPQKPFVSNLTGQWADSQALQGGEYWRDHLRQSVQFGAGIEFLCEQNNWVFVELGPGDALTKLISQNAKVPKRCKALCSLGKVGNSSEPSKTLAPLLGDLYCAGLAIDWHKYYGDEKRKRLALPTYSFEHKYYYPEPKSDVQQACDAQTVMTGEREADAENQGEASRGDEGSFPVTENSVQPSAPLERSSGREITGEVSTEIQTALKSIWCKHLGLESIGITEDLFSYGVDSLLSIRVITEIRNQFGVEIALERMFEMSSIEEQEAEIKSLKDSNAGSTLPAIELTKHNGVAVLSSSQKRLWVVSHLEQEISAYNCVLFFFVPNLCLDTLRKTFETILQRHAILRTVYGIDGSAPFQRVLEDYTFDFRHYDFSECSDDEREQKIKHLIGQDTLQKFNLAEDLMIRVSLIKLPDNGYNVMITQHHITFDNWTTNLFIQEINLIYDAFKQGESLALPELPVQYIDYAIWQESWLKSQAIQNMLDYWKKTLDGIPQVHSLPLDKVRPPQQNTLGDQVNLQINKEVSGRLEEFSKAQGVTLFMTLQAAFAVFLSRYSGESDIVVGFAVANRPHLELENVMGIFVNTLVLRSDLSSDPLFLDFLAKTKQNLTSAYANQAFPFELLVEELNPERSLSYEPIVQIHLTMLNQDLGQDDDWYGNGGRRTFTPLPGELPYSKYDLTLYVSQTPKGITTSWEYPTSLFERETIERMAVNFSVLLENIISNPNLPASKLAIYSETEKRQLLLDFNHLQAPESGMPALLSNSTGELALHNDKRKDIQFSLFYFANDSGSRAKDKYELLLEGAKFADANHFESIWTPERHFDTFGGLYPNPAITSAAIASVTENLKIRAGSCVLPLHNTVRLAEDWSVIDNISGGRVGIGVAAGFHPRDFTIAPEAYHSRQEKMLEQVEIVRKLWRGESLSLRNGLEEMDDVTIRPLPIQAELPIWLTTTGNIHSFKRAGRMGIHVLTHLMGQSPAELKDKIAAYREEWRAAGNSGNGCVTVLIHAFVSEDQNYVYSMVKEPFKQYLKESIGSPQFLQKHLGVNASPETQADDVEILIERAFSRYYKTSALLGTPQSCLAIVEELKSSGVDELACLIDFGVDDAVVFDNLIHLNRLREISQLEKATTGTTRPQAKNPLNLSQTWLELFEQQAKRSPNSVAFTCCDKSLSYAQVESLSLSLAKKLRAKGIARGSIVALLDYRDLDLAVMIIAVLRAGAAFLPIDPTHPVQRWCDILDEAQPALLVVGNRLSEARASLIPHIDEAQLTTFDELVAENEADQDLQAPTLNDLAYVIFTSGSTGRPKGAMVEHFGMLNNMLFKVEPLALTEKDVVAQTASQCFDISVFQFLAALTFGGSVAIVPHEYVIEPEQFLKYLAQQRVSIWVVVPSVLHALLPFKKPLPQLRWVLSTGEAFPPSLVHLWFEQHATVPIYNSFGPAECSDTIAFEIIREPCEKVFIGKPVPNARLYVVDENIKLVPLGAVGELAVSGAVVGRGYLNRPDLTANAFINNPYSFDESDRRLYLTGDLVRRHNDGRLEYLGRKDFQVKIRGFRVELGEIEKHILKFGGISQAVVHAVDSGVLGKQLVAYIIADAAVRWDELRLFLRARLPEYMVPVTCMVLDKMPLSANGKIVRRRLPMPNEEVWRCNDYLAPEGPIETALAEIWQIVLGVSRVGRNDNFFDLGGNSILAISMLSHLKERDVQLTINEIYQHPVLMDCCEGLVRDHRELSDWLRSEGIAFKELQVAIENDVLSTVLIDKMAINEFSNLLLRSDFTCMHFPDFIRFTESLDNTAHDIERNGIASLPDYHRATHFETVETLPATLLNFERDILACDAKSQLPLSPMQKEWLVWNARDGVEWIVINGFYTPEQLQKASLQLFQEQDLLHSYLDKENACWNELDITQQTINIPVLSAGFASKAELQTYLLEVVDLLLKTSSKSPLPYAAAWVSVNDTAHHFLMAADHLVTDGASSTVIKQRLSGLLAGSAKALTVNYRDYVQQVWDGATQAALETADQNLMFNDIAHIRSIVAAHLQQRSNYDLRHVQLEVPLENKTRLTDDAFELFKRVVSYLLNVDQFVMTLNQYGRKLGERTYFDQVGLFLDKIPCVIEKDTSLEDVSQRVEHMVNQGVNFLALKQKGFEACVAAAPVLVQEIVFNFVTQGLNAQTELIISKVNMDEVLKDLEGILFEAYPSSNGLLLQIAFRGQQEDEEKLKMLLGGRTFSINAFSENLLEAPASAAELNLN